MSSLRIVEVLADSRTFARHHGLRLPKAGDTYSLGAERGEGKFGFVWSAQPSKARSGEPAIVIKESKENVGLANRVGDLQKALARSTDPTWPERLLALPYSVAVADVAGDRCEAIFMLDLVELGYEKAEQHFEQPQVQDFQKRPAFERVELAYSYARAAALLEGLRFLHGDQNVPNLMVNLDTLDTQLVDLDAGAVMVTGEERSLAEGKADDCTPPEVKVFTPEGVDVDLSLWDLEAERWAVGTLVGYLAFGIPPTFALSRVSPAVIDSYAEDGPWPRVDLHSTHARAGIDAVYEYWRPVLEAGPGRLTETFGRFFRAGTRGAERPTAQDWVDALEPARQKPQFAFIEVTPRVAPEGTEVTISWEAEGAEYVEHPELGALPAAGEESLVVTKSRRYTLGAVNYYGRVEASTEIVRVVPLPKLTSIPIAGFPGLELQARIAAAAPARPTHAHPPRLVNDVGVQVAVTRPPHGPRLRPAAPRFSHIFRPIPVSRKARAKMRKELNDG